MDKFMQENRRNLGSFELVDFPDETQVAKIREKIEAVATRVYGAAGVFFYPEAEKRLATYTPDGLDRLPVCMAKTHLSLSADPTALNALVRKSGKQRTLQRSTRLMT